METDNLLSDTKGCRRGCLTLIITYIVIFLLGTLLIKTCNAQSIGLDLQVHSNSTRQYGLVIEDITHCTGLYYNRLVNECNNADHYQHRRVSNIEGYSLGIIVTSNYERISFISLGFGELIINNYDNHNSDRYKTPFLEVKSGIRLKSWLDLTFGFSSYPTILSGLRFKINF